MREPGPAVGERAEFEAVIGAGSGDTLAMLHAHHALALSALYSGRLDRTKAIAADHLRLADDADEPYDAQFATMIAALAAHYDGDLDEALAWAQRSRSLAELCGAPSSLAWSDYVFGELFSDAEPSRSRSYFESAIATGTTVANELVVGVARLSLTTLPFGTGHEAAALEAYAKLIESWSARNDWTHQWTTLQNLAPVLARCGADTDAAIIAAALAADGHDSRLFGDAADEIAGLRNELRGRLGVDELERIEREASLFSAREIVDRAADAIARLHKGDDFSLSVDG